MTMRLFVLSIAISMTMLVARPAAAQDPPPRIGPYIVDLHATVPRFPKNVQLAASRDMDLLELPGSGPGLQIGVHVYPIRWRAVTFGIGEFATGRARNTPVAAASYSHGNDSRQWRRSSRSTSAPVTAGVTSAEALGTSTWAVVPKDRKDFRPDSRS